MSEEVNKSKAAGGIPAIRATLKTLSSEMGLVRGVRTLLKVNQQGGVDCPGCAWPEPDRERSHFEFCENGAKHIADEATTKRVTPEFFEQWSVADLAQQSDQWLGAQGRITHPMLLRRSATHYEPVSWDDAFELIAGELIRSTIPTRRSSTPRAGPATKRHFCINSSCDSLAQTIFLTAQTCVTSRVGQD